MNTLQPRREEQDFTPAEIAERDFRLRRAKRIRQQFDAVCVLWLQGLSCAEIATAIKASTKRARFCLRALQLCDGAPPGPGVKLPPRRQEHRPATSPRAEHRSTPAAQGA